MANTRDSIGDQAALDGLINHSLTTFEEDGVTTLRSYALYHNDALTEVSFPNVTSVPTYCCQDRHGLEEANFPSATSVGNYAFSKCYSLKEATFGNLTNVNQYAFQECHSLNDVDFSKVTSLGNYALDNSGIGVLELPVCTSVGTYTGKGCRTSVIDITKSVTLSSNRFNSAYGLCHLILRHTSLCSFSSTNALANSGLANGIGWIYVPSDLVDTYKAATNWSAYASQIVALEEYPKALQNETITDTWAEIISACNSGTHTTKYSVGDIKYLNVGGTYVAMQIVAFNTDILSDGTSTAPITWMSLGLIDLVPMNPTSITTDGWEASFMRSYLREAIYNQIDSTVKNAIKPVQKTFKDYTSSSTKTVLDTVWIPSYREMFGGTTYENSGVTYTSFFSNNASRIKKYGLSASATYWWTRSANSATYFMIVTNNGSSNSSNASTAYGVALGFCT